MDLTQRFSAIDHSWDEEGVALEANRGEASSRADSLVLGLYSFLFEHGVRTRGRSELQLAFCCLQTKLAKREKALRVATAEVGALQALLKTER